MRIAVIEHAQAGDYADYIISLIDEKAKQYNYQTKVWSNSVPAFQQQIIDDAVVYIYIESTSPILLNWLYKVKIPSVLKKIKAEVVVDLNGIASDKIKIPQLIITAPSLLNKNTKQLNKAEKFAFKNLIHSATIAKNIFIYSNKKQNEFAGIEKEKLQTILFTAPGIFKSFEWHEKIMVKAQHADNKEYFIAMIEDDNADDFVLLLQAFSKFKKWQESNMQLLVLPKYEYFGESILSKLKTYKYRDDVRLIHNISEKQIADIMASAYAFIHIATKYAHLLVLTIAIQCSLPVISFEDEDVREYTANAALFCNEKKMEALGSILIQMYKDENLHAQLKEAAAKQAANLSRKEYEDKLWQLLHADVQS